MASDQRRQRKEIRLMQSEAVWLQKALFALRKAEDARDSVMDVGEEEPEPYAIAVEDRQLQVSALENALEERIDDLLKTVRERRRTLR